MGDVFDDLIDRQGSPADAARVAADLETGGGAEMPVMQERSICAPVHMIKLTQEREITPYVWVHPEDDDRR
jgi:hypothetical protein